MPSKNINVGIIGVGNCASSLIQGIEYYGHSNLHSNSVGLLHGRIGQYTIGDINCVAAFDVDRRKVGRDISEAIFAPPNCTSKFCDVPFKDVIVDKAPVMDGIGENLKKIVEVDHSQEPEDVCRILEQKDVEILINYLPSGSERATKFFANEAIKAGCGFINAIPVFVASTEQFSKKFFNAKLPLAGDDIKSQIGSTIVNRALIELFNLRGVRIEECTQTCEGGNTDFLNLSEKSRAKKKIVSKTSALTGLTDCKADIEIIPPRYIEGQKDKKISIISLKGKYFGDSTVNLQLKLEVEDSPNSAGEMVDIIRLMKLALDNGRFGTINEICSFYFKHPKTQIDDFTAFKNVSQFIKEYS